MLEPGGISISWVAYPYSMTLLGEELINDSFTDKWKFFVSPFSFPLFVCSSMASCRLVVGEVTQFSTSNSPRSRLLSVAQNRYYFPLQLSGVEQKKLPFYFLEFPSSIKKRLV